MHTKTTVKVQQQKPVRCKGYSFSSQANGGGISSIPACPTRSTTFLFSINPRLFLFWSKA
ncbi:hypothetical protein [Agriterribacter sp.]|uniref:hypothetical protein n=1 Tax=Agriterribacter sp. TaxID=2821509 RepID=UPI002C7A79CD|nr:hypothetical protein [Agriterribacter sp.]HRP56591.1 hypothetical protein [Agriterribacter sp.]